MRERVLQTGHVETVVVGIVFAAILAGRRTGVIGRQRRITNVAYVHGLRMGKERGDKKKKKTKETTAELLVR